MEWVNWLFTRHCSPTQLCKENTAEKLRTFHVGAFHRVLKFKILLINVYLSIYVRGVPYVCKYCKNP